MTNKNNVLIISSQPQVVDWLYKVFDSSRKIHTNFFIENTASTRESGISIASEIRPGIIFFFEKTAGVLSISETLYRLRLTGARVIYISDQRNVGDLVLEAVVGYGVYDIILQPEITQNDIEKIMFNPQEFKDVAILHRIVEIADNSTGKKSFKIPELDVLRSFSNKLDENYLMDPSEKIVANISKKIDNQNDKETLSGRLFRRKKDKPQEIKTQSTNITPKQRNHKNGLGDIDFEM